jgi:hypothetical protein
MYIDTTATDHITSDLNKLSTCEQYKGYDQVHHASGQVWKSNISVIRFCIPLIFEIFYMFLVLPKTYYLLIKLP